MVKPSEFLKDGLEERTFVIIQDSVQFYSFACWQRTDRFGSSRWWLGILVQFLKFRLMNR